MTPGIESGAKRAKLSVRAARKAVSRRLDDGQARAQQMVDASRQRADQTLEAAERAALGVLDTLTARGRDVAHRAEDRLHAFEDRVAPRRRPAVIGTAMAGLGAGVLLSLLLAPRRSDAGSLGARRSPGP